MSEENPIHITSQGQELLNALRSADGWVGRSSLAERLGKKSLNKWHLALIAKYVEANLIETRQISHHGPIGFEWQYRAVKLPGDAE